MRLDLPLKEFVMQYVKIKPGDPIAGVVDYDAVYRVTHAYQDENSLGLCKADNSYDVCNGVVKYVVPISRLELTYRGVRPDPKTLLLLDDGSLDEMLLELNQVTLRQTIREALKQMRDYKSLAKYYKQMVEDHERKESKLKDILDGDDY